MVELAAGIHISNHAFEYVNVNGRNALALASLGVLVACGSAGRDPAEPGVEFAVRAIDFPGGAGSAQAHLAALPDGSVLLSWLEPAGEDVHTLRFAVHREHTWSDARTVMTGQRLFVNWADFPSVVPVTAERWVAHWLALQPDSFGAYDAFVAVSADGGVTWSEATRLNEDDTEAEHGFVEIFAVEGTARVFWLDGRELASWSFDDPDAFIGVSLREAVVGSDGSVSGRRVVDPIVCDCCQPDVAVGSGGPIVTYRDRTETEIRDIVVRRWRSGAWSDAADISGEAWRIEGCPVNGPTIAAAGRHAAIAWFTAAGGEPRVRIARSSDGGDTFGLPVDVDRDGAFGQTDIVIDGDGSAVVSWWRRSPGGGIDLAVRRLPVDGAPGPLSIVGHEAVSQPVDVPQMMRMDDGLLIVWSSLDGQGTVKAVLVTEP